MGFKARASGTNDAFAQWKLGAIAARLAAALDARQERAEAECVAMTPLPGRPGFMVSIYGDSHQFPRQRRAFGVVYPRWADFRGALVAADPAAVETGVEVLSRVNPAACLPLALELVGHRPWNKLWDCVARALARADDETAFRALLQHNRS